VDGFDRDAATKIHRKLGGDQAHIAIRTGLDLGVLQGDVREVVIRGTKFRQPGCRYSPSRTGRRTESYAC